MSTEIITRHYTEERVSREQFIKENIGYGDVVRKFNVDKGHKNGPEIHTITSTGIIIVHNALTGRKVTTLIARPGQIYRYWANVGERPPKWLMDLAQEHQDANYNYK